jgi:hypothetical protein
MDGVDEMDSKVRSVICTPKHSVSFSLHQVFFPGGIFYGLQKDLSTMELA